MSTQTLDSTAAPARARSAGRSALLALITRLHFYIGLFVGPFILVAAVTGTLFVLTPQIENLLYADQLRTASTGAAQPLADQVQAAQARIGAGSRLFAVRPAPAPGETTRVMFTQPGLVRRPHHAGDQGRPDRLWHQRHAAVAHGAGLSASQSDAG